MPVIKSAKKKLRQDRKREKLNNILRNSLKKALKEADKSKNSEKIRKAVSFVDKSVKKGLMHKNKAARIKSRLSKLTKHVSSKPEKAKKAAPKLKVTKTKK